MAAYPKSASFKLVLAMRTTSNVKVTAVDGDLDTVIGSGFSPRHPFWYSEVPGSVALLSNGIDPMQRWDAATGVMEVAGVPAPATSPTVALTGTTSAQAAGAFLYGFVRFYDNYGNVSDLSPIGQGVSGYSVVTGTTYTNVATPAGASALKVVGRQLLRNTPGQATTFYVDVDTRDLTSTTFTSTNADSFVQTQTPVPLLSATGAILANIHGFPPSWKAVTAAYLGRVFATAEVTYSIGNVVVASYSKTVQGIGTNWPTNFAGRHLFLSSPPGEYEIASVDAVAQTLQLTIAYNGPTDQFAIYGIRAPAAEWRNIYYTPTGMPESWPPSYALSLQDDGDEITGLMQLGSFLYILEKQHIYRLTFLTDPALDGAIFLSSRRGCLNQRMWVQAESTAYIFDALGVHSFSGGNSQPISDPIQDLWRDNGLSSFVINWNADTSLWSASYNATHTTVRFFVAMTGSRYPRHALCYNYRSNRWWIEEYPRPVCSTTLMTIQATTRTLAGMDANNVCALDVGYLDGTRGIVPTIDGLVTAQSACSLTDQSAAFTNELVNLQVAIVQGRAKGQSRRIIAVTHGGTRLALQTPWNVAPAVGDRYEVGAIAWSWKPGWFRLLDDAEGTNARDVEILFQPLETTSGSTDVEIAYNYSDHPRIWTTSRDGTATVTAGDARVEIDFTDSSGRGIFRMEGHRERYLDGDVYLSPQLAGYQHKEPLLIYRVTINGVSSEG